MGKKSPPPPPDYTALATAQASQQNDQLAQQTTANRANQYNPWGSQTWGSQQTIDPATGKPVTQWSQTTTLDPRLQSSLDSQLDVETQRSRMAQGLIGRMQSDYAQPMDFGGLNPWGTGPQQTTVDTGMAGTPNLQYGLNFGGTQGVQGADANRQKAQDAIYQSATSRLDPQWDLRQRQMDAQLANKGITSGSQAYTDAMADFNRQRTDAYGQATMSSITGAGAEAQRDQGMDLALRQQQVGEIGQQGNFYNTAQGQAFGFGQQAQGQQMAQQNQAYQQQLSGAGYANSLRQQQLAEAVQQRGFSLNEIQAMLQGQQVNMPTFGSYSQAGQGQAPDLMGAGQAQFGAQMQGYNAQQAANANLYKGIGGIAGAFMGI